MSYSESAKEATEDEPYSVSPKEATEDEPCHTVYQLKRQQRMSLTVYIRLHQ